MKDARTYIYNFKDFKIDNHENILKFKLDGKDFKRKYTILGKPYEHCYIFRFKNERFFINKGKVQHNYK